MKRYFRHLRQPVLLTITAITAGFLALAACSGENNTQSSELGRPADPAPALWEITSSDGTVEGWLFGTIHALPDGADWNSATLTNVQNKAEYLVVEVGELEDKARLARAYTGLAMAPEELLPLSQRVAPAYQKSVLAELDRIGDRESDYDRVETWAAALSIAQKANPAKSGNGVDLAMIRNFSGRRIEALESAEQQFGMFDSLPEQEQADFLLATLREVDEARSSDTSLAEYWLQGDTATIESRMERGILADPELRETLLERRNAAWLAWLQQRLPQEDQPLIAVGTAHLVGPDGLVAQLEQNGYKVRRIQ